MLFLTQTRTDGLLAEIASCADPVTLIELGAAVVGRYGDDARRRAVLMRVQARAAELADAGAKTKT